MASENEQEKRETLADIVAEMRRNGDAWCEDRSTNKTECLGLITLKYADRIEAAWRREKSEIEANALAVGGIVEAARHNECGTPTTEKSSAVGNAAEMREALDEILERIDTWRTDGSMEHWQYSQLFDIADAALSAPARNCDKFVSQPEMSRAYEEYRKSSMKNYGNGLTGRVPTVKQKPMTYDEWLLAPAAERKGETDGR